MLVLIPAYRPDTSLLVLIRELGQLASDAGVGLRVLVVDDGSGPGYRPIFGQVAALDTLSSPEASLVRSLDRPGLQGVTVLTLEENGGKGAALRAGFRWAQQHAPGQCVVTADADGQHLPADILAVGERTRRVAQSAQPQVLVMGVRTLADPTAPAVSVPLRSRLGNALTAFLFRLSTGQNLADTQTGLRGFPPQVLDWALSVPGDRYDYEFTMLLRACRFGIGLVSQPITRVYEPGNPTSHFQPVRDSLRIYAPLLAFLAASFSGFLLDTVLLLVLVGLGLPVVPAVILARCVSALANFALNRLIMHDGGPRPSASTSLGRYALLATGILATNAGLMEALSLLGLPLLAAKVLVELVLVPTSFALQRRWVFHEKEKTEASPSAGPGQPRILATQTL